MHTKGLRNVIKDHIKACRDGYVEAYDNDNTERGDLYMVAAVFFSEADDALQKAQNRLNQLGGHDENTEEKEPLNQEETKSEEARKCEDSPRKTQPETFNPLKRRQIDENKQN